MKEQFDAVILSHGKIFVLISVLICFIVGMPIKMGEIFALTIGVCGSVSYLIRLDVHKSKYRDSNLKMEETGMKEYVNRELSWLKFNKRVLEEAEDKTVPLCERLSFISIFQSNLQEFFMVRVGTLQVQMLLKEKVRDNKTNMTSEEQIKKILGATSILCNKRDAVYDDIMQEIEKKGFKLAKFNELSKQANEYLERYFETEIEPLLSPMIVGKKQSFPFMSNDMVYAVVVMDTIRGKEKIGIVPCGSNLFDRMIKVPDSKNTYVLVEELILHFVSKIFEQYNIRGKSLVKITRNADINIDSINDEDLDYRDVMVEAVKLRKKLAPVRLELTRELDMRVVQVLCVNLRITKSQVFISNVPLNTGFISDIRDILRENTGLFNSKYTPEWPANISKEESIISQIEKKDVLLSYPYDSIKPFLKMLHEAAQDEEVFSIKMTLYRLAKNSKVIESLIEAAENGKEVVVLVELMARFDEENNIHWSRRLEEAGCHVIYGIDGVKVHSKICLISKKKENQLEYIVQIGTGNYNEKTAELYTDLTLMTANQTIGNEVAAIFTQLGMGEIAKPQENLLVAPNGLQNRLVAMIDEQIEIAKSGKSAYIGIKANSLTDIKLMEKLIEASNSGVKIDMIIRGICCLVPGIKGKTENITIKSIVGRYLEHSRIYIFGSDYGKMYIGSADWMTRNTLKRIEVATPIFDEDIKNRIKDMFNIMLLDNIKARTMNSDGEYTR